MLKDEIYAFNHFSRDAVHVIMSLNPASLKGRGHRTDGDYAIAWCKLHGKGRVFYTALGHDHELWDDPRYQQHLLGGIRWALGAARQEPYRPNQRGERVGLVKGSAQGDALLTIGHRKTDAPWQPILDGKPLAWGADWEATDDKERTRKHWTVCADGILTGDSRGVEGDGSSHIYYIKKAYKNFEVRAEISINEDGNSGFYFRCPRGENERGGRWRNWPSGYEAQINLSHGDPKRSGTHYASPTVWAEDIAQVLGYAQGKVKADDFWYTMRIVAVGDHTVIFLNDRMVVDHIGPAEGKKRYTEGLFAFQMHHRGTVVRLKNLAVRELSPDLR